MDMPFNSIDKDDTEVIRVIADTGEDAETKAHEIFDINDMDAKYEQDTSSCKEIETKAQVGDEIEVEGQYPEEPYFGGVAIVDSHRISSDGTVLTCFEDHDGNFFQLEDRMFEVID